MKKKWFRRKWYGYGWFPATWQGWLVILIYLGIVALDLYFAWDMLEQEVMPWWYWTVLVVATVLLVFISWKTGEKPRWQWGRPKKEDKRQ